MSLFSSPSSLPILWLTTYSLVVFFAASHPKSRLFGEALVGLYITAASLVFSGASDVEGTSLSSPRCIFSPGAFTVTKRKKGYERQTPVLTSLSSSDLHLVASTFFFPPTRGSRTLAGSPSTRPSISHSALPRLSQPKTRHGTERRHWTISTTTPTEALSQRSQAQP